MGDRSSSVGSTLFRQSIPGHASQQSCIVKKGHQAKLGQFPSSFVLARQPAKQRLRQFLQRYAAPRQERNFPAAMAKNVDCQRCVSR
jgi:hypothetical protein